MVRRFMLIFGLYLLAGFGQFPVQAGGLETRHCTRADGQIILAAYDYGTNLLALMNPRTGAVEFEIDRFSTRRVRLRLWSDNCRYLFGIEDQGYVVWDTESGGRAFFTDAIPVLDYYRDIVWEQTQYIAIVDYQRQVRHNFYVWDLFNQRVLHLVNHELCSMYDLTWDLPRQEIWGIYNCGNDPQNEIRAYSLIDGTLINEFPSLPADTFYRLTYKFDHDKQYLTIAHFSGDHVMVYRRDGTLLGDLETGHTYLENHALSPDGRYYVVAQNQLRVWDLAALNADTSQPNFTWDAAEPVMLHVKFIDATTVEVTLMDGITQRWNILTRTPVG